MTPEQYQRAKFLFSQACDLPAEDRNAWLQQAESDAEIRSTVEQLLANADDSHQLVDAEIASGGGARMLAAGIAESQIEAGPSNVPERIGPYRIVRTIGRGGMGVVYQAEQDHPRRTVALKVLPPSFVNAQMLSRFRREADLLGRLQHPGIAQIYEAGVAEIKTDAGVTIEQPYFAMELVAGQMLDDYARDQKLALRDRLALFAKVCDAVHHAHERGVIHRDLKPSNILVEERVEGSKERGLRRIQPKILDFGVSRATNADIQTVTMQTHAGQLIGTMPYMSPEQVAANPDLLDSRSDVYSLGVVLYELLADRLPHDLKNVPIPEAVRIIQNNDPSRLSSIHRGLRGDVETIVAKALEKETDRRYQSAADLGADIRRYLTDEPLSARPASTFYQLRKFARRNRVLVGGMTATMLAIIIGGAAAVYFAIDANRNAAEAKQQEHEAIAQRDSADAVTDFLAGMLAAANPEAQGRDVTVRQALDQAAAGIDERFEDQPLVAAKLRDTIGQTYQGLGHYDAAEDQLSAALQTRTDLLGPDHRDTILTQIKLGEVYYFQGRLDDATRTIELALAQCQGALDEGDQATILATHDLAFMYMQLGRHGEAESMFQQAIDGFSNGDKQDPVLLETQANLAMLYDRMGRPDDAAPLFKHVIEVSQRVRGPDHPATVQVMANLASLYLGTKQYEQAFALLEEVLEIQKRVLGEQHSKTLISLNNLANAHRRLGQFDSAERVYRDGMATASAAYGDDHPTTLMFRQNLGTLLADFRRYDEARPLLTKCYEQCRNTFGEDHPRTTIAKQKLTKLLDSLTGGPLPTGGQP